MSQPRTERAYRGMDLETRVAARRRALIETGLDCLHADGLAGVSVRSICARARLTPRYFYESFADLDELLVAVIDTVADEVAAACVAAIASSPPELAKQVRALVDAGYGVVAGDPRKATAILVAAAGHGPLVDRWHRIVMDFADIALDALPALGALTRSDRTAAKATAMFLIGGAAEVISGVLAGSLPLSRAALVDQVSAMWVAVLSS